MVIGSLFSGIGGFDLGFERAGMKCAWQCEIDDKARLVLKKHFGVKVYEDVRTIGKHNLEPVDVLCGGFPCQDLSIAGKRKGLDGERSGLWFEFARIIDELEPRWVVIENVPGLLSSNKGTDFAVILRWLVERGYGVCWRVLDAQYFGVAQRRRRVFIVASFRNGNSAKVLFESEGVRWDPPARGKTGEGIAGTLDGKSCSSNRGSQANKIEFLAYNIQQNDNGSHKRKDRPDGGMYVNQTDTALTVGSTDMTAISTFRMTSFGEYSDDGTSSAIKQRDFKDATDLVVFNDQGGSQMSITKDVSATLRSQEHGHQPVICWEMQHASEAYRQSGDVAPVLQARMGTGGNNIPLVGVRRLTPVECERLQGFPDGWTEGQTDSARYKQLGNAVAVPVAEWIGRRIMEVEHGRTR